MYVDTNLKGWLEEKLPALLPLGHGDLDVEVKLYTFEFTLFIG
jgi:hypothetical protein